MAKLIVVNFMTSGEPEYILAKAGLYRLVAGPDGYTLEAGETLSRLFGDTPIPPPAELVPVLLQLVRFFNMELGGAIDPIREGMEALEAFRAAGIPERFGRAGKLYHLLRQTTRAVAEERRNRPPPFPPR